MPAKVTPAGLCTCIGCPVKVERLIAHAWQDQLWLSSRVWRPCPGLTGKNGSCDSCQCPRTATDEDLLCGPCRAAPGVSRHDAESVAILGRVLLASDLLREDNL